MALDHEYTGDVQVTCPTPPGCNRSAKTATWPQVRLWSWRKTENSSGQSQRRKAMLKATRPDDTDDAFLQARRPSCYPVNSIKAHKGSIFGRLLHENQCKQFFSSDIYVAAKIYNPQCCSWFTSKLLDTTLQTKLSQLVTLSFTDYSII